MIDGIAGHPFSAETLPPPTLIEASNKTQIIKSSQERYGVNKPRDIQRIDFLNPEKHSTQPRAHVPGHFNRDEVREILSRFRGTNTNIWVYHAAEPFYFESDVAQGLNLHIPVRRQRYILNAT